MTIPATFTESHACDVTRDALLAKPLAGEVHVPEVAHIVEEAG